MVRVVRLVAFVLIAAFSLSPTLAEAKKIKLRLTYNNKVDLGLISLHNQSELDFILDGSNISVYYPDGGEMKFVGDKTRGHGYYFGPVDLRFRASRNVIDLYGYYKTHILHTRVTTDGQSSCNATIETRLKPGYTTYEYDWPGHGSVTVRSTELSNIQCELSTV